MNGDGKEDAGVKDAREEFERDLEKLEEQRREKDEK